MSKRGKIVLINPSYLEFSNAIHGSEWVSPPLGLGYIASVLLRSGYEVEIIDMAVQEFEEKKLKDFLLFKSPEIVGITSTTPAIKKALNIASMVKGILPNTLVVLGGVHPTCFPEELIRQEEIDVVVQGEGELTFLELVELTLENSEKRFFVCGTVQKSDGKIIFNPRRPFIEDLDSLPFPAHQLFNLARYRHPLMRSNKTAAILTSRGCPFNCTYCNRGVFNRRYRMRSPENVIEEIEYLINKHSVFDFAFIDDNFTLDRSHIEGICNGIVKKGLKIKWSAPNGVHAKTIDFELAKLMKKSGCYSLSFGIESGNQKTLDYIKKNIDLATIRGAFEVCRKVGIETVAFIIIGFPNENRNDIDNTLHFLKDIKVDIADFHILIPLPKTAIYEELKNRNYILEEDWSKYTFHNEPIFRTDFFSPKEIFYEYKRAYRKFYLRPGYILSRIKRISSLQEIKNDIRGLMTILTSFRNRASV
ncbi:MAG: radical SAM protein [Candidatus Omnitrophota bacterium]